MTQNGNRRRRLDNRDADLRKLLCNNLWVLALAMFELRMHSAGNIL
jgi:hypothetical protein